MAANVETMAYYGAMPWHGLGTKVEKLMTADECLVAAGLDWKVTKEKIFFTVDGKKYFVPNKYATVRNTDNRPLGVVGASYQPVQNADALNFMDTLTQNGEAKYETAGSLQFGRIVWVMAQIPNGKGIDPIEKYLLCTTSHDGSSPVMVTATPVRVVCNNTLNAALKGAKNKFRIRHTTNVESKIEEARKTLADSLKYFTKLEEKFEQMKGVKFTQVQLENLVLKVFKNTEDVADLSKRQSKSLDGILGEIVELTEKGAGVNLPGVRDTAWGAYNAVAEFLDHKTVIKGGKGVSAEEKLMASTWFGTVANKTQESFDNILEMVKLAA
jgi:phage/plasmid-like protein (TIGR03299 family)